MLKLPVLEATAPLMQSMLQGGWNDVERANCSICNRWPPCGVSNEFEDFIFHLDLTDREELRGASEMQLVVPNPVTFIYLPSIHGITGELAGETYLTGTYSWMAEARKRKENISFLSQ